MVVLKLLTVVTYFVLLFVKAFGERKCNATDLSLSSSQCYETEFCDGKSNVCDCLQGYIRKNDTCILDETNSTLNHSTPKYSSLVDNQGNGSLLAGLLIPGFLIIFVICSIYLNKKYELVKWFWRKIYHRHENYDEFMIGQDIDDDDPPLH